MSQERQRFPIQPKDRKRTAKSSRDIHSERDEQGKSKQASPDKPTVPPHRRHDRDSDQRSDKGPDE